MFHTAGPGGWGAGLRERRVCARAQHCSLHCEIQSFVSGSKFLKVAWCATGRATGRACESGTCVLHTQGRGQLPGDKAFLFTFFSVVENFLHDRETEATEWLSALLPRKLSGPSARQTAAEIRETPGTRTHTHTPAKWC